MRQRLKDGGSVANNDSFEELKRLKSRLRRVAIAEFSDARKRLHEVIRSIVGDEVNLSSEIARRAPLVREFVFMLERLGKDSNWRFQDELFRGELTAIEKYRQVRGKQVDHLLSAACHHWLKAVECLPSLTAESHNFSAWRKAKLWLDMSLRAAMAAHTIHLEQRETARIAAQRKHAKLTLPQEEVARDKIQEILRRDPSRSGSEIASDLLGVPPLTLKHSTLEKLAREEKKKFRQ